MSEEPVKDEIQEEIKKRARTFVDDNRLIIPLALVAPDRENTYLIIETAMLIGASIAVADYNSDLKELFGQHRKPRNLAEGGELMARTLPLAEELARNELRY